MTPTAIVAITFADGSVGRSQFYIPEPTDEDIRAAINKTVFAQPVKSWRRVSLDSFPVEHSDFRDAWTDDGAQIAVDMERAKEVTRNRLRAERAPLFAERDIDALRAIETGDVATLDAIAVEKQRLRDITKLPDAAKSLDDLRAIKP